MPLLNHTKTFIGEEAAKQASKLLFVSPAKKPARPRLLFINRSYWPDVEATGQLLTELCEDLAGDFDVTVLCGRYTKVEREERKLGTKALGNSPRTQNADGQKPLREPIRHNGVTIRRIWHTKFNKASFVGRLTNMLSFQLAAFFSACTMKRPDIVVVETDPPFLCLLGRTMQLFRRTKLVCYLQDIYPDVAVALGKLSDGIPSKLLRNAFFRVYRKSDAVVVLSDDMKALLVESSVPKEKIHIVPNWIDTDKIIPVKENNAFRHMHDLEDKFVVMYSGNIGLSQNLSHVLDVAERLKEHRNIVFTFVGNGAGRKELERVAKEKALSNVQFFDYQPKSELAISLSAADVHIVVLRPEIDRLLMPSKLYGVLASGTPAMVLANPKCELARIVSENDLGIVIDTTLSNGTTNSNTKEPHTALLTEAILKASNSPDALARQGKNARAFATANCTRRKSTNAFNVLLGGKSPSHETVQNEAEQTVAAAGTISVTATQEEHSETLASQVSGTIELSPTAK